MAGTQLCSRFRRTTARAGSWPKSTSLPNDRGIGDFGLAARQWIDRLHDAGQSWWQVLPLGPIGDGDSPYYSPSSFAANELLISPDDLIDDGLLRPGDCAESVPETASVDAATGSWFRRLRICHP